MNLHTFLILIILYFGSTKIIETPAYVFQLFDNTTSNSRNIFLSPDSDQIMVFYYNRQNKNEIQSIINFNGTKACSLENQVTYNNIMGWPLQTKGIIKADDREQIFKQKDICSIPFAFINLQQDYIDYEFRNTSQFSYITFLMSYYRVSQYDLNTGKLYRNYTLTDSQRIYQIKYSPNNRYLYAETETKVIIYNADTLQRLKEISCSRGYLQYGFDDGKGIILLDYTGGFFFYYYVNETNTKLICNIFISIKDSRTYFNYYKIYQLRKTLENVFPAVQYKNNQSYLTTYNFTTGEVVQNFTINLKGKTQYIDSNDNYLAIVDDAGYAYIFKYNHTKPQPDPQPKPQPTPVPNNNDDLQTLIWVGLLIAVVQTVVIILLVLFVCRKRKQQQYDERANLLNGNQVSQISN